MLTEICAGDTGPALINARVIAEKTKDFIGGNRFLISCYVFVGCLKLHNKLCEGHANYETKHCPLRFKLIPGLVFSYCD